MPIPGYHETDAGTRASGTQGEPAFPQVVAYRLFAYHGLNLLNLFTEQIITHVQTLVKYGSHREELVELLLQATGELLQLKTGMSGPLFRISHHLSPCVTTMWFSQCWQYCIQSGIEISTDIDVETQQA